MPRRPGWRRRWPALRASVDELLLLPEVADGEHREVLEAYRMFAHDAGWRRRISEAIRTGLTAEAAVRRVQEETRLRMGHVTDSYLKERLHDLDALADRLLVHLTGRSMMHDPAALPNEFILVARSLGPAELIDYDRSRLRGVILEEGSPTSHVAIVARALWDPHGRPRARRDEPDRSRATGWRSTAITGRSSCGPARTWSRRSRARSRRGTNGAGHTPRCATSRRSPSMACASACILNAAFLIDLVALETTNADGIGLYRTELAFMVRGRFPDVDAQTEIYAKVRELAGDKPVVFRTLDVGSDKHLPYWTFPERRESGDGLARAAHGAGSSGRAAHPAPGTDPKRARRPPRPDVPDGRRGRGADRRAGSFWTWSWHAPRPEASRCRARLRVGAMLEVPALIWQLPALLPRIDFLSIGTNDLLQFLFACDRGNPAADRPLRRAVAAGPVLPARAGRALPGGRGDPVDLR